MRDFNLELCFWGVRGSIPTPEASKLGHGGNTSCVEVRLRDGDRLVLDAGTGIRSLGETLVAAQAGRACTVQVFLTHYHWDHIQGIPFFRPLYDQRNEVVFHGSGTGTGAGIRGVFDAQMGDPFFPVSFEHLPARKHIVELTMAPLQVGGCTVTPFPLNHPQGAVGYRIDAGGSAIVYATDHEHGNEALDRGLAEVAAGADILIYDAHFTPEEYETHRGWGHSTWQQGARIAGEAGVDRLILFHHDPRQDDEALSAIERQARAEFTNTDMAREGASYVL